MNSIQIIRVVAVTFFAFIAVNITAQNKNNYEIGINAGTFIYQGDLTNSFLGTYKGAKPAIGVFVSKDVDPYFSWRINLMYGKIGVDESQFTNPSWKQLRNFKFTTSVAELSSVIVWNFFGDNGANKYSRFSPYVFGGVGISLLNVKRDWHNINRSAFGDKSTVIIGLGVDTLHRTPTLLPIIPVGIGFKYAINNQLSVRAEGTYRIAFSDYIDGFSQSVNASKNDTYYGLSIGVSYKLFTNIYKCPTIKR